ncbi:DUF2452 domain-containing protein [Akkermansiaceae bacterium]|nr:DUF2452 domain-containing protein [Akkermansiaceae bacterium]MDB4537994.1 DUF2452 domain-containing protein [Akkermansiaceae bacterium]
MEAQLTAPPSNPGAFLPYPVSTLSPRIIPNDLSNFKSRGISQIERDLQLKLEKIREEYIATIEHFNWNKLVYEAEINFEPIAGETYHLYTIRDKNHLSMIGPDQWPQKHLASFRLNLDRQWELLEASVEARSLFAKEQDIPERSST